MSFFKAFFLQFKEGVSQYFRHRLFHDFDPGCIKKKLIPLHCIIYTAESSYRYVVSLMIPHNFFYDTAESEQLFLNITFLNAHSYYKWELRQKIYSNR